MSLVSKMVPLSSIAEALLSRAQISRVLIGIPTGPGTYLHTSRLSGVVPRHKALPSEGAPRREVTRASDRPGRPATDIYRRMSFACRVHEPGGSSGPIPGAACPLSVQQYVKHDDRDRNAECQKAGDRECAARRSRQVCFHTPHRARIGARTDRVVQRNVGISDAAVSAHHGPSRAVVLFQDRDAPEPPEPTLADVGQVGTRDTE